MNIARGVFYDFKCFKIDIEFHEFGEGLQIERYVQRGCGRQGISISQRLAEMVADNRTSWGAPDHWVYCNHRE